jgi:hypothetical protein
LSQFHLEAADLAADRRLRDPEHAPARLKPPRSTTLTKYSSCFRSMAIVFAARQCRHGDGARDSRCRIGITVSIAMRLFDDCVKGDNSDNPPGNRRRHEATSERRHRMNNIHTTGVVVRKVARADQAIVDRLGPVGVGDRCTRRRSGPDCCSPTSARSGPARALAERR